MPTVRVPNAGSVGVIKDLSQHELPLNAWTDASNVRFLDGYANQFYGHGPVYGEPAVTPLHVLQVNIGPQRYWMYASSAKLYTVSLTGGVAVHTNITRQTASIDTDYTVAPNQWTSTTLSGIPIFNPGNEIDPPQQWNLQLAQRAKVLDNWPAATFCKSMRAYKNILVALNVTKAGINYPYMVKFSAPADPGSVPITWDPTDQTNDAGEFDLATGGDPIIDGLELRNSLMVYKEQSVWRLDYIGGQFILASQKVFGMSGAMNRNCIVEVDGIHFVLTGSDVVVHDGQTATSVLDKVARRSLFQDMDAAYNYRSFVFKNPFLNEVYVCYVAIGGSVPNKALVWNYKDRTVSYRTLPNLNHAAYGSIDNSLNSAWSGDNDAWDTDITAWNGPDFTPNTMRVLMASDNKKLYLLDASASFDGLPAVSYLERRGIGAGDDEYMKTITSIRARITGNNGLTVRIKLGGHNSDPYADPEYPVVMDHIIGETISDDGIVSYRYPAIRIESGTAAIWRLDSYDYIVTGGGQW